MSGPSPITATGLLASEPARLIGLITAAVSSVLALLVALGLPISEELTIAILGLIGGLGPIVAGVLIRARVYAPDTVENLVQLGVEAGKRLG